MNEVIYKIRVNRPCRLFIDDEEMMILDENRLTKITLPEGEYLRKVVAIDNKAIYDEAEITLSGASKLDTIPLDTTGLEEAKHNALPKEEFQVGDLMYMALEDGNEVAVAKYVDKNITEVIIPEEIVYGHYIYEVKEIEGWAFWRCTSLISVTIPNSVTRIGTGAFRECSGLTSVTIPNSVTRIRRLAFSSCSSLTSIVVEKGNAKYDCRENCNAIVETATNTLISGCQNTIIPNSVTRIENGAFEGCSGLTSVTIPNSVTSIGKWAFAYCSSLTSVTIGNSVTSIGNGAFEGCSKLKYITIPNGVTSIGEKAFVYCKSLTSITIPSSVTSIGWNAFDGTAFYNNPSNWDKRVLYIDNCLIAAETNITGYYNIKEGTRLIAGGAFADCSGLTSITIPNSVTSIGDDAFRDCSSLTSITIPNSVTIIGDNAFPNHTRIIRK